MQPGQRHLWSLRSKGYGALDDPVNGERTKQQANDMPPQNLSRWERNFWMRRQDAKIATKMREPPAETKIRELSDRKSPQKGPIWRRIGNVRFAETGWWAHQGSNLGPDD